MPVGAVAGFVTLGIAFSLGVKICTIALARSGSPQKSEEHEKVPITAEQVVEGAHPRERAHS